MKKYIIFSFCTLFAICVAYTISYQKLSEGINTRENQDGRIEVSSVEDTVKPEARLIMENYNASDGTSEKKVLAMPAVYLGLTRSGVTEKLEEYMENLSITDLEKGLVGFDLMYFSPDCLLLRKTYQPAQDFMKYYVKLNKGCITVYYSDRKTVYEYTDMDFNSLPSDVAGAVLSGMELRDEKALYDFLENYSS